MCVTQWKPTFSRPSSTPNRETSFKTQILTLNASIHPPCSSSARVRTVLPRIPTKACCCECHAVAVLLQPRQIEIWFKFTFNFKRQKAVRLVVFAGFGEISPFSRNADNSRKLTTPFYLLNSLLKTRVHFVCVFRLFVLVDRTVRGRFLFELRIHIQWDKGRCCD